jgi:hypothetical protein
MKMTQSTTVQLMDYVAMSGRLALIAAKLLCVYVLSQSDATFFYQQF